MAFTPSTLRLHHSFAERRLPLPAAILLLILCACNRLNNELINPSILDGATRFDDSGPTPSEDGGGQDADGGAGLAGAAVEEGIRVVRSDGQAAAGARVFVMNGNFGTEAQIAETAGLFAPFDMLTDVVVRHKFDEV